MPHGYKHHLFYGWQLIHDRVAELQEEMDYEPVDPTGEFRLLVDNEFKRYCLYGTVLDWADDTNAFSFQSVNIAKMKLNNSWLPRAFTVFDRGTGKTLESFIPMTHPSPDVFIVTELV